MIILVGIWRSILKEMGDLMKNYTANRLVFCIGAIVIGSVFLIWPGKSLLLLAKCVGIVLAAGGIMAAVLYIQDHADVWKIILLILGAIMLICGIVIFLHPDDLVKLIPTIMGVLVIISGVVNLGETLTLTRKHYARWWLSLLVALITIGLGVLLITKAFGIAAVITRVIGGVLVFDGLSDLWVVSRVSKAMKQAVQDASAIDVPGQEAPEGGDGSDGAPVDDEPADGGPADGPGYGGPAGDAPVYSGPVDVPASYGPVSGGAADAPVYGGPAADGPAYAGPVDAPVYDGPDSDAPAGDAQAHDGAYGSASFADVSGANRYGADEGAGSGKIELEFGDSKYGSYDVPKDDDPEDHK